MSRSFPLTPYGEYYARRILNIIKDEVEVDPRVKEEDVLWLLQPPWVTHLTIRHAITMLKGEDTALARQWDNSGDEQDQTIDYILDQMQQIYNIV